MEKVKIIKLFDNSYVRENVLNHHKLDFNGESKILIKIRDTLYSSVHIDTLERGSIGVNTFVRSHLNLGLNDNVSIAKHIPLNYKISNLNLRIVPYNGKSDVYVTIHEEEIKEKFLNQFKNYYLYFNQCLYLELNKDSKFLIYVTSHVEGYLNKDVVIEVNSPDVSLNIVGSKLLKRELFRDDYNFEEELGIGGLDKELINVLRRCLSTRAYKPETIEKLGIKHVKGLLLYGVQGTGKTLTARKIGGLISNKPPKVVNGPEIMNKYIGESEKNIRELFVEAMSDKSEELHIIIFDEIDAICKRRQGNSSSGSNVNDSIVNQLLTMLDGYTSLNNIFVIGMTNRKDLLDEALLRPGRLEVHLEIGLPDRKGREQIFRIHTKKMTVNNMIEGFDAGLFAEMTENYTGAEIEAVVRNAANRSLHENLLSDGKDRSKGKEEENEDIVIRKRHFIDAIKEVVPVFGNISKDVANLIPEHYEHLSENHKDVYNEIHSMKEKSKKRINSFLITGENRCGKTVLAIRTALAADIKNVKFIRAIDLVSKDEIEKAIYIGDLVKSCYVSEESVVVIDDIEIVINFAQLGDYPSFSNRLYQVLLTILKTEPLNKDHKITFICTCSTPSLIKSISKIFDKVFVL